MVHIFTTRAYILSEVNHTLSCFSNNGESRFNDRHIYMYRYCILWIFTILAVEITPRVSQGYIQIHIFEDN